MGGMISADKLVGNFRRLQRTDRTIVFKGIPFCQNGEAKHPTTYQYCCPNYRRCLMRA
jgi:hypothetical protein